MEDIEAVRQKNILERDKFFESCMGDPEFAEAVGFINKMNEKQKSQPNQKRKRNSDEDSTFKAYKVHIPEYLRRKSARLQNCPPDTDYKNFLDMEGQLGRDDLANIEQVIFPVRKKRNISGNRRSAPPVSLAVEDVTQKMLDNIARKVSEKTYHDNGTSCHQCRQKTLDTKTVCRNPGCFGVRGQFCGVCIQNRYGEDAADALKDPKWTCFPCRGICNCSFCRIKQGKRPTGILTHIAQKEGHRSVKDFLESLGGEGDFSKQDEYWLENKMPNLLGFQNNIAVMEGGVLDDLANAKDLNEILEKIESILFGLKLGLSKMEDSFKEDDPDNVIGFSMDSMEAYLASGRISPLKK